MKKFLLLALVAIMGMGAKAQDKPEVKISRPAPKWFTSVLAVKCSLFEMESSLPMILNS